MAASALRTGLALRSLPQHATRSATKKPLQINDVADVALVADFSGGGMGGWNPYSYTL